MCVEHMVKLNNPVTASNGEHAIWLDGVKVSHLGQGFPNGSWTGGKLHAESELVRRSRDFVGGTTPTSSSIGSGCRTTRRTILPDSPAA